MTLRSTTLACLVLTAPLAVKAESLATSASSTASSATSSASESLRGSSNSSSPDRTAAGEYRVTEVAALADKPGQVRLTLEPVAQRDGAGTLWLDLPQQTAQQHGVAVGVVVAARARPYGLEFAQGEPRQPFFLVLDDTWYREMQSRAL